MYWRQNRKRQFTPYNSYDDLVQEMSQFSLMDPFLSEAPEAESFDALQKQRATIESSGSGNMLGNYLKLQKIFGGADKPQEIVPEKVDTVGPDSDSAMFRKREESNIFEKEQNPFLTPNGDWQQAAVIEKADISPTPSPAPVKLGDFAEEEPLGRKEVERAALRTGDTDMYLSVNPEQKRAVERARKAADDREKFDKMWPAWLPIGQNLRGKVSGALNVSHAAYSSASDEVRQDMARKAEAWRYIDQQSREDVKAEERTRRENRQSAYHMGDRIVSHDPVTNTVKDLYKKPPESPRFVKREERADGSLWNVYDDGSSYPATDPKGQPAFGKQSRPEKKAAAAPRPQKDPDVEAAVNGWIRDYQKREGHYPSAAEIKAYREQQEALAKGKTAGAASAPRVGIAAKPGVTFLGRTR